MIKKKIKKIKLFEEIQLNNHQKNIIKKKMALINGNYNLGLLSNISTPDLNISKNLTEHNDIWKKCTNIIQSIKKQKKKSHWFLKPVNKKIAPQYHLIVKYPMDLRTVENNIKKTVYKNPFEFRDQMRLIWNNCRLFNSKGSLIRESGEKIQEYFEHRWENSRIELQVAAELAKDHLNTVETMPLEEILIQFKQSEKNFSFKKNNSNFSDHNNNQKEFSFEEKRKLSIAITKLSGESLTNVLKIVTRDFKKIEHILDINDDFEIDLEMLDRDKLLELQQVVTQNTINN